MSHFPLRFVLPPAAVVLAALALAVHQSDRAPEPVTYSDPAAFSASAQAEATVPVPGRPKRRLSAAEWRNKYPFESLADRMADLDRHSPPANAPPAPLTDDARRRLDQAEQSLSAYRKHDPRTQSLQMLHSKHVEKFLANEDRFGVSRMVRPSPDYLELQPAGPIAFAAVPSLSSSEDLRPAVALPGRDEVKVAELSFPSPGILATLHDEGALSFVNVPGLGHGKERRVVAGFQPHQFRHMPDVENARRRAESARPAERWKVSRLELVSLLKHERPAVYVSEELPRMDALKKATTREPTPFEAEGLTALRAGEDLATEATANRIRMVASLRANNQCLDCHAGRRGDLLGAFSYVLQRDPPAPE